MQHLTLLFTIQRCPFYTIIIEAQRPERVTKTAAHPYKNKRCTMPLDVYCHEFSLCPDSILKLKMASGFWKRQWSSDSPWLHNRWLHGLSNDQGMTNFADGKWKHKMKCNHQRGRAPHWARKEKSLQTPAWA